MTKSIAKPIAKPEKPPGYVFGRPTKYRPEMCETVIFLMKQGGSKAEVAAELGLSISTLHEWIDTYQDFSQAMKEGLALSQAWWERTGRESLHDPKLRETTWYRMMVNRFGYRDQAVIEQTSNHKVSLDDDSLARFLAFRAAVQLPVDAGLVIDHEPLIEQEALDVGEQTV